MPSGPSEWYATSIVVQWKRANAWLLVIVIDVTCVFAKQPIKLKITEYWHSLSPYLAPASTVIF